MSSTALVVASVAAGGAVGAPSRYLMDRFVTSKRKTSLPVGTMAVNVSGSFLLGVFTSLALPPLAAALLATGFCGGYTTFSTFEFETVRLVEERLRGQALLNIGLSLLAGLLAAAAGMATGAAL
ncbi:MAG: fluoride efflux transporter CrcB [Actinomycetota bacterium]|nr:fluoride efflux transporter CrcB [Actinomycetota bacterium]